MADETLKPVVYLLREGGYRVTFDGEPGLSGSGPTIAAALQDLSRAIARVYEAEKGDDSSAAQTARLQTDILANDRFIRGGQLQQSVLMAMAMGLM